MLADFPKGFPAGYRERFAAHSAVVDMQHLLGLDEQRPLAMSFYQPLAHSGGQLHCKLYHADTPLPLSDVLPILENLGLRVLGEFPYIAGVPMAASSGFTISPLSPAEGVKGTSSSSTTPCRMPSCISWLVRRKTMPSTAWS